MDKNLENNNSRKSKYPRITFKHLFEEFLDVINFERGFLYTIKTFIVNPRRGIEEYFYTKRLKHANPIRFLIFSTAIYAFLQLNLMGDLSKYTSQGFSKGFDSKDLSVRKEYYDVHSVEELITKSEGFIEFENKTEMEVEKATQVFSDALGFIFEHSDILTFGLVPIFSVFTILFFRKSGFNLPEHLVINSYLTSIQNTFGILLVPLGMYDYMLFSIATSLPFFIFCIYFWVAVFQANSGGGVIKAILTLGISYLVYFIVLFAVIAGIIVKSLSELN